MPLALGFFGTFQLGIQLAIRRKEASHRLPRVIGLDVGQRRIAEFTGGIIERFDQPCFRIVEIAVHKISEIGQERIK